jgi:hypothetical protein
MKGSRVIAAVLVFLTIVGSWGSAMAEPILYTIEFVASGAVDGVPFSNERFVFAGVTDSGTVEAIGQANLDQLAQVIAALGYVVGLPFVITSIVKFKAHKNNPNPVRHPIGPFGLAVEISPPSELTRLVVRDGALAMLTIDSILNNTLVLEIDTGNGPVEVPGTRGSR